MTHMSYILFYLSNGTLHIACVISYDTLDLLVQMYDACYNNYEFYLRFVKKLCVIFMAFILQK